MSTRYRAEGVLRQRIASRRALRRHLLVSVALLVVAVAGSISDVRGASALFIAAAAASGSVRRRSASRPRRHSRRRDRRGRARRRRYGGEARPRRPGRTHGRGTPPASGRGPCALPTAIWSAVRRRVGDGANAPAPSAIDQARDPAHHPGARARRGLADWHRPRAPARHRRRLAAPRRNARPASTGPAPDSVTCSAPRPSTSPTPSAPCATRSSSVLTAHPALRVPQMRTRVRIASAPLASTPSARRGVRAVMAATYGVVERIVGEQPIHETPTEIMTTSQERSR